jgi:hypothetical protein
VNFSYRERENAGPEGDPRAAKRTRAKVLERLLPMAMAARLLRSTEVSRWLKHPTPITSSPLPPFSSFFCFFFHFLGEGEGGILWPGWSPWVTACMCAAAESILRASGSADGGMAEEVV